MGLGATAHLVRVRVRARVRARVKAGARGGVRNDRAPGEG